MRVAIVTVSGYSSGLRKRQSVQDRIGPMPVPCCVLRKPMSPK